MSKTSGKHNPDDVLIGFLDSPEVRALTMMVAEAKGTNVSDMFRRFVFDQAQELGMMENGKVVGTWREKVRESAELIRANKKQRSERRKRVNA